MAPLVRRSLFKSNKVGPKPPTAEEASSNLIPTNELIVNEWKENKSKKEDVFLLKLIDEMPKDGKKKRKERSSIKGSKGGKGSKKMYAGKLKLKTCPYVIGNLYCPEHVVDKFRANHEVKHEDEMTKLYVYHKRGVNDLEFVGNITCNTHPDTPASYLDNGLFIVTANDDSIPGGIAVATTEYRTHIEQLGTPPPWSPKKYNTALTFYELRWFMDHPYFITLVLTVIADHTVMHVKKKKNRDGSEALTKKPKPTSFIGKDYKSNLESLLDNLSKVLVFMTRKVNPDKSDPENDELLTSNKTALSQKRHSYPEQAPFTLSQVQTSCFQPKPLKKNKLNPKFSKGRIVHTTMMPLKINEVNLQRRADKQKASLAQTV